MELLSCPRDPTDPTDPTEGSVLVGLSGGLLLYAGSVPTLVLDFIKGGSVLRFTGGGVGSDFTDRRAGFVPSIVFCDR